MISVTDQMGHLITLKQPAKRVVSLVPSQTELLYYLGIAPIGQTVFCVHPKEKFQSAHKIGGTKKLQIDKIRALQPDLIIGNKEENVEEQIEELKSEFTVWMSDVNTLKQAYTMIDCVGQLIGKKEASNQLTASIQSQFSRLITPNSLKPRIVYLIWNDPYFGVARNTFIDDVLQKAGYINALDNLERYPQLTLQTLQELQPDYLFLSSEPFPFNGEHQSTLQSQLPNSKVMLVDGEAFSWYGNRLLHTPSYIENLNSDIRNYESES